MKITYDFKEFCLGKMTPRTKRDAFFSKLDTFMMEMRKSYERNQAIQIAVMFGSIGYDVVFIFRNERDQLEANWN